jgi:histidyl-tRNA synthetase
VADLDLVDGKSGFLADASRKRDWVVGQIRSVFERHGFEPMRTSAFESRRVSEAVVGPEVSERLLSVVAEGRVETADVESEFPGASPGPSPDVLCFDLTIPLIRMLLSGTGTGLPLRGYQVHSVWRASEDQTEPYEELLHCEADFVGSSSPVADAECLAMLHEALRSLGFSDFFIRLNHLGLLESMVELLGAPEGSHEAILGVIDRSGRGGRNALNQELQILGIGPQASDNLWHVLERADPTAPPDEALAALAAALPSTARPAVENLADILENARNLGVSEERIRLVPTLHRRQGYYSGAVFEADLADAWGGPLAGGGRFDGLTRRLAAKPVAAVGVGLYAERILAEMARRELLPKGSDGPRVLVAALLGSQRVSAACMPEKFLGRPPHLFELNAALRVAAVFRAAGHCCRVQPEPVRLRNLLREAEARRTPFVAYVGARHACDGVACLKRTSDGSEWTLPPIQLLPLLERP